jgi:eukaryotic-like serine/threonine-protein kinase
MTSRTTIGFAETMAEDMASRRLRAERAKALFGDDAEDPMTIGRFALEGELGSGGQGAVFVARDPELDRKVALKRLHSPDAQKARRLLEEAKVLARFKHDNVVQVYEVGTDTVEGAYMVMELVDGTPLRKWLEEGSRSWLEVVDALVGVAKGVAALHDKGVVHRDIKPDNVVMDASGRVKLVDLGIALVEPTAGATTLPEGMEPTPLEIAGTYAYMAPEQLRGEADARSDQYAFCVMMHEALFGAMPRRRGKHKVQRPGRHGEGGEQPAARGRIPAALDRVLERGLQHEPSDRFESMSELAARLEAIVRWRRWGRPAVAAAVGLVATLSIAAYVLVPPAEAPCGRAQTGAEIWSDDQRQAVQGAFVASEALAAGAAFTTVDVMLTSYAADLDGAHEQACTALVEGQQAPAAAHARLACLARSQGIMAEVVEQLATASADEVANAAERLGRLPVLAECASPSGATEVCDADASVPGHEEALEQIGLKLQAAEARIMLGRYDQGLQLAKAALDLAEPEALAGVRARAWLMHGRLAYEGQQLDVAIASLEAALSLAERQACDGVAAEALTLMAKVRALQTTGDADEALRWSQQALDKLDRRGDDGLRRADALNSRGLVLHRRLARFEEADALYREAAALREKYLPEAALALADTLLNRGSVLASLDRIDEAISLLEHALALRTETLGADHPGLFKIHVNLGNRRLAKGDLVGAEAAFVQAIDLASAGLGPQHRKVGELHLLLVAVLDRQRRFDEALAHGQQALDIYAVALAPDDLEWITAWGAMGQVYNDANHPEKALPWLQKVWELVRTHPTAGPLKPALAAYRLGVAEAKSGAPARALPWLDQALEQLVDEQGMRPGREQRGELHAHVQRDRGEVLLVLGRADAAVTAFEDATRWWTEHDGNPESLALARSGLARAIVARDGGVTDGTRARVAELSREALAWMQALPADDTNRTMLAAWMTEHGFAPNAAEAGAKTADQARPTPSREHKER